MTYRECWQALTKQYDESEAKAVARLVAEVQCGLTLADLMAGEEMKGVEVTLGRLLKGEPVQYVLGKADFGPRTFIVAPGVLIPRPETYELCRWCLPTVPADWKGTVLDIGTGSGCIACTLAAELPQAQVTAWDISEKALEIARENAHRTHVHVSFEQVDILSPLNAHQSPLTTYDLMVSNPPYVCEEEQEQMEPHVLDYEPREALFVPDNDPLLFYRAIGHYALHALKPDGRLFFELNPRYAHETASMLGDMGFNDITIKNDQFNKERFIRACR